MTVRGRVEVRAEGVRVPGGLSRLRRDLDRLLRLATRRARRGVALDVLVTDDEGIRRIHRDRMGDDTPTDVITFPITEEPVLWGNLVLSAETAAREAARRGHPAYDEVLLYAVHGVLHLLGHDDHDPDDRRRMRRGERAWLRALGVGPVFGGGRPKETRR